MNLIEVKISDLLIIEKLAKLHYQAYQEKFNKEQISHKIEDYIKDTINDIQNKRVFTNEDISCLIVCEDRTDALLNNSTYHLITRIYVSPSLRGKGMAKIMVQFCQNKLGKLMGYNGKFYHIGEIK
jgi:predicted GNAT family acetyltransferase